jgi:hypothetical protein
MAQNTLYDFSTTAGSNTDIAGISVAEGWLPSTVNNYERAWMAIVRKDLNDKGGTATVAGTANAIAVTSASPASYGSLVNGLRIRLVAGSNNSAATTLNLDSLGAKAVRKIINGTDAALAAGDITAGVHYDLAYSTAANAAAGGWIITPSKQYAPDGTAALPSMSFDQDIDTGFYRIGANNMGLALGGALGLNISATAFLPPSAGTMGLGGASNQFNGANLAASSAIVWDASGSGAQILNSGNNLVVSAGAGVSSFIVKGPLDLSQAGAGSNGQIIFPATQVASANVNTLDDYEEGTWTPVLSFATPGNLTVAYTTQLGQYQKIGKLVTLWFSIVTSTFTHTTASGNLQITGVPFTPDGTLETDGKLSWAGITKATYTEIGCSLTTTTTMLFRASGSGVARSIIAFGDTPTGGTMVLNGSISYMASA